MGVTTIVTCFCLAVLCLVGVKGLQVGLLDLVNFSTSQAVVCLGSQPFKI